MDKDRKMAHVVTDSIRQCTPQFAWHPSRARRSRLLVVLAILVIVAYVSLSALAGNAL